jgi:hypothetical protein
MLLGHATHDEDGGCREVGGQSEMGQAVGRHLCILEQAELILEFRQLPRVLLGAPAIELGAELERVAKALAADAEPVEFGCLAGSLRPSRRLDD